MATIPKIDRVEAQDVRGLQGVDPGKTDTRGLTVAGEAMSAFGRDLQTQVADSMISIGAANQARDEDRQGDEAATNLQEKLLDERYGTEGDPATAGTPGAVGGKAGWSTLRGNDALTSRQSVLEDADKIHQNILEGLTSERARDRYMAKANAVLLGYDADNAKHTAAERDKAEETANEAAGKVAERSFYLAPDATAREQYKNEVIDSVISTLDRQGVTDPKVREVAIRERISLVYKQAITNQLNLKTRGGNALAKELLAEGEQQKMITQKHLGELTKTVGEELLIEKAQNVADTAFSLHPTNEKAARDYVKSQLKGEQREKALGMIGKDFAANVRNQAALKRQHRETASEQAYKGITPDQMAPEVRNSLNSKDRAWYLKVAEAARNPNIQLLSDPGHMRTLQRMSVKEPAKFAAADLTNYRLNGSDLKYWRGVQRSTAHTVRSAEGKRTTANAKTVKSANSLVAIRRITDKFKPTDDKDEKDDTSGLLNLSWTQYGAAIQEMNRRVEAATERGELLKPSQMEEMFKSIVNSIKTDEFNKTRQLISNQLRRRGKIFPEMFKEVHPEFATHMQDLATNTNTSFQDTVIIATRLRQMGRVPTSQGIIKFKERVRQQRARRVAGERRDLATALAGDTFQFTGDVPAPTGDRPLDPLDTSRIGQDVEVAPVTPPGGVPEFTAEQEAAERAARILERVSPAILTKQVADQVFKDQLEKVNEERAEQDAPAEVEETPEAPDPRALRREEAVRKQEDTARSILDEMRQRASGAAPDGTITGSGNTEPIKGGAGDDPLARGEVPPRPSMKPALPNWQTSTRERNKIIKFWSKNYQSTNNPVKEKRATKDLAAWIKSGKQIPKSAVSDIDVAASIFEGDKGIDKQTLVQIAEAVGIIESGFRTKVQTGGGPARSYWQVEPKTALSLVKNSSGLFKLRNKKSKFEQEFEAKYAKPARFDEDGNVMDGTALEYLQSLSEAEMSDVLEKDGKLAATLALAKVVNRKK